MKTLGDNLRDSLHLNVLAYRSASQRPSAARNISDWNSERWLRAVCSEGLKNVVIRNSRVIKSNLLSFCFGAWLFPVILPLVFLPFSFCFLFTSLAPAVCSFIYLILSYFNTKRQQIPVFLECVSLWLGCTQGFEIVLVADSNIDLSWHDHRTCEFLGAIHSYAWEISARLSTKVM